MGGGGGYTGLYHMMILASEQYTDAPNNNNANFRD